MDVFLCLMFDTTIDTSRARLADGNAYFSLEKILFPVYLRTSGGPVPCLNSVHDNGFRLSTTSSALGCNAVSLGLYSFSSEGFP